MVMPMKSRSKLLPGQKGAKALQEKYGDAFVCVRYRYDVKKRKQYKTVEIIVSEKDWIPPAVRVTERANVSLKIGVAEKKVQAEVKALGGRMNPELRVWLVPYGCILGTRLEKFIILQTDEPMNKRKSL